MPHTDRYYVVDDVMPSTLMNTYNAPLRPAEEHFMRKFGASYPYDAPARTEKLYPSGILNLSDRTKANLAALKQKLVLIDPCYELSMKHWHRKPRRHVPPPNSEAPEDWSDLAAQAGSFFHTVTDQAGHVTRTDGHVVDKAQEDPSPFCYLCTTLDEHRRHQARSAPQLKKMRTPRPRVHYDPNDSPSYIPPLPAHQSRSNREEKKEILYKISVETGNKPHADTTAKVTIRLNGDKRHMKPRQLSKRMSVKFCFGRNTKEAFYLKGPRIGNLKSVTIENHGTEQKDDWFLANIEVTNMETEQTWEFSCNRWLGAHTKEGITQMTIRAQQQKQIIIREFDVEVETGTVRGAGTDANVYITFYGNKGVSAKHKLTRTGKNCFEKGKTDSFPGIQTKDIGKLSKIKIEHDNSGMAPGWFLEKVRVTDLDSGKAQTFPCGQWLATDEADHSLSRILFPFHKVDSSHVSTTASSRRRKDSSIALLSYQVSVLTGTQTYAGTDARVYIKMVGQHSEAREVELDDHRNNFENGMTDTFKITADDVGDLKHVVVRHDNSGLGAGWFLKEMTIRRYFSEREIEERLEKLTQGKGRKSSKNKSSRTRSRSTESESEDNRQGKGRRKHKPKHKDSKHRGDSRREQKRRDDDSESGTEEELSTEEDEEADLKRDNRRGMKLVFYKGVETWVSDSDGEPVWDSVERNKKLRAKIARAERRMEREERLAAERQERMHTHSGSDSQQDSDEDSDQSDAKNKARPKKIDKSSRHKKRNKDSDSDGEHHKPARKAQGRGMTHWSAGRLPYCDEYRLPCNRWLATDEDDGQITRTLKPSSITTYYKVDKQK